MSKQFVNISGYHFVPLENLAHCRAVLLKIGEELGFKGTILLAPEGINLNLAGTCQAVSRFIHYLHQDVRFMHMTFKESFSRVQPFRRFRVRLKSEIIKMGVPTVKPGEYTSTHLPPEVFQQWLDEERDITILDTRNHYEIKVGTFKGAKHLNIEHFNQFPDAAKQQLDETLKDKPLVMFCTGGVRCEKAGPLLEAQGFKNVYQLDGGILNYFETCHGEHWEGECFVFDDRVAVDKRLQISHQGYCPNCAEPVDEPYRHLPHYERVKRCQHCRLTGGVAAA